MERVVSTLPPAQPFHQLPRLCDCGSPPDNDGIHNLTEYAVAALVPTVGNGSVVTFIGLTLSFTKRQPLAGDIAYSIEQSTDLGASDSWDPVSPAVNDDTTISHTLAGGPPKGFVRLKVGQN